MKHKITLEYVIGLHRNALNLDDKIVYITTILDELRYLDLLNEDENINIDAYIRPITDLRNNILHLRKNSLDKDAWDNR